MKVFTHIDLDGAAAASVIKRRYPDAWVEFCNYDNLDEKITSFIESGSNEHLMITDVCPNKQTLKTMDEAVKKGTLKVTLIDHHVSRKWCAEYPWAAYNPDLCGAQGVYRYYQELGQKTSPSEEEFLSAVGAYDLWKINSPYRKRGEDLNLLVKFLGLGRFMNTFSKNPDADLMDDHLKWVLEILHKSTDKYVSNTLDKQLRKAEYNIDNQGNRYKILFADKHTPQVGHGALDDGDSEDLDYVVIINPIHNACALYSRDEGVDVSKIAIAMGGGGHKGASGFMTDFRKDAHNRVFDLLDTYEIK